MPIEISLGRGKPLEQVEHQKVGGIPINRLRSTRQGYMHRGTRKRSEVGYGTPYLIEFNVDGRRMNAVLSAIRPGSFGP